MQSEDQPPERENQPVDLLDEFGTGILAKAWPGRRPSLQSCQDHTCRLGSFFNKKSSGDKRREPNVPPLPRARVRLRV